MKNALKLTAWIIGCELVGVSGTIFTISAIPTWYAQLNKPFFAPPNWLFGPVWTILYALMGVAGYLLWQKGGKSQQLSQARQFFLAQLVFNFIWTPVFFGLRSPAIALCAILPMVIFTLLTILRAYHSVRMASWALLPYLLWISFASLLNAAIVVLN